MARFSKGEFIAKTRSMGYPTKEIAEMLYKDGGEIGQSKVRAMYSYLKKKGLLLLRSESSKSNSKRFSCSRLQVMVVVMMMVVVAFSNFPNKTCDLTAEKFSFSKFRFKSCDFGTTTPTANFECKNHNFWNPNHNPNHNFVHVMEIIQSNRS